MINNHSAMAVLAGACVLIAGANLAHAVNLSPNGLGEVLLFPYYTVNNSQDTQVSIANDSPYGLVAKVRFLDGRMGRPVLDFDLYLSAHDTWTANVSQVNDDGGAILSTSDHSCTTPTIPAEGLAFTSGGYDGSGSLPADNGPHGITRTREGSIEVIAGGEIIAGSPTDIAITQVQNGQPGAGTPPGCATLPGSLVGDIAAPTSSLYGYGAIVDVGEGIYYAYNADAINGFTDVPLFTSTTTPLEPSLLQANSMVSNVGGAVAYVFTDSADVPNYSQVQIGDFSNGIDAVTAVFMADSIANDYIILPSLGASTDWVVDFPTKRFYVDPIYGPQGGSASSLFNGTFAAAVYDREEGDALPSGQEGISLPYDVNVISFLSNAPAGAPSGVFGSVLNTNIAPTAETGSMRLDAGGHRTRGDGSGFAHMTFGQADANLVLFGEPVTGFMASNVINANAQPGQLANYGATFRHRTRACSAAFVPVAPLLICQR